jgi:hypothetical protein
VPLSLNEAREMSIEDVVLVTTVREDIRHQALQVDRAEIPHCIQAAQAGMVAIAAAAGARALRLDRRPKAEAPSASAAKYNAVDGEDDDDSKTAVALSPVDVRRAGKKEESGQLLSPVPNRPAETRRPPGATSAWGKILVVPSPTLSVQPHLPAWGTGTGFHHESHDPSAWRRLRVKTTRCSSAESGVAGDGSDSDRG